MISDMLVKELLSVSPDDSIPFDLGSRLLSEIQSNAVRIPSKVKPAKWLPNRSGVYFLFRDFHLIYIGQSIEIPQRLIEHRKYKTRSCTHVCVVPIPVDELERYERKLIRLFKPLDNRQGKGDKVILHRAAIKSILRLEEDAFARLIDRYKVEPHKGTKVSREPSSYNYFDVEAAYMKDLGVKLPWTVDHDQY